MLDNFSTKATVTKCRAIHGKMLNQNNYRELISKQSVSEVAAYLKKTPRYRDILATIDTNTVHRGFLETLLRRSNFALYVRLCKFQMLDKINFYNYDVRREEVQQILSCILHLNANNSEDFIITLPSYLLKHASFDLISLARAKTFNDLLKVIKNTPYIKILNEIQPDDKGRVDYLRCEVLLRTGFYIALFEDIDNDFSGDEAKKLKVIIKSQIDLINVINAYRMKAYYHADPEEIKKTSIPFHGRLGESKMNLLFEATNKDEMLELFKKTIYARKINTINLDMVEKSVHLIRYKNAKSSLTNALSAPVALYTLMYLCDCELENLTSIIEGIRYKVSPEYIEKLLIM